MKLLGPLKHWPSKNIPQNKLFKTQTKLHSSFHLYSFGGEWANQNPLKNNKFTGFPHPIRNKSWKPKRQQQISPKQTNEKIPRLFSTPEEKKQTNGRTSETKNKEHTTSQQQFKQNKLARIDLNKNNSPSLSPGHSGHKTPNNKQTASKKNKKIESQLSLESELPVVGHLPKLWKTQVAGIGWHVPQVFRCPFAVWKGSDQWLGYVGYTG